MNLPCTYWSLGVLGLVFIAVVGLVLIVCLVYWIVCWFFNCLTFTFDCYDLVTLVWIVMGFDFCWIVAFCCAFGLIFVASGRYVLVFCLVDCFACCVLMCGVVWLLDDCCLGLLLTWFSLWFCCLLCVRFACTLGFWFLLLFRLDYFVIDLVLCWLLLVALLCCFSFVASGVLHVLVTFCMLDGLVLIAWFLSSWFTCC